MEPALALCSFKNSLGEASTETPSIKTTASLDGGGVRAIIPARICQKIEECTQKRMVDLFDCFAGTSAGAIVASALNLPEAPGTAQPKFSAAQIVQFFKEKAETIFPYTRWYNPRLLFTPKYYPEEGLYKVLDEMYGDTKLSESIKEIVIPVARLSEEGTDPWWFTRDRIIKSPHSAQIDPEAARQVRMADVLKGTCSAPFYFPYATCEISGQTYKFMDGGTFANNPSSICLQYARLLYGSSQPLMLGCFGTGKPPPVSSLPTNYNSGALYWLFNYPAKSMDLNNGESNLQAETEINIAFSDGLQSDNIFRFQPKISYDDYTLDDSTPATLERLLNAAEVYIDENEELINKFCQKLLKTKEP